MAAFAVELRASAEKELRKLPASIIDRISGTIDQLRADPIPYGSKKLMGHERAYRLRVGDYRIVYTVNFKARQVIIERIRHRSDVYRAM